MSGFVHLHLHSEYSLLDGACRISDIPKRAKELGMSSIAITDHGVMYGCVDFYDACKNEGIKPIIGCEVYVAEGKASEKSGKTYHLVLLCKNEIGYKNLIKIVSKAQTDGFYGFPRTDNDELALHSEGLIALSGCLGGRVPSLLTEGRHSEAKEQALILDKIFGRGNFYLELQDQNVDGQKMINECLVGISELTGIPIVATNDVHYINKEDADTQAVMTCIQTGTTLKDGNPLGFKSKEYYLKSYEEMHDALGRFPEALSNTEKIAEQCNFDFTYGKTVLPVFTPPNNLTADAYLRQLADEGLDVKKAIGEIVFTEEHSEAEYRAKMQYELLVIAQMGYSSYFLIVADFVNYAKSNEVPTGPGRGSGAGSLIAYLIGITEVDPVKYGLLFDSFLNRERISMPDFDIDFGDRERQKVIDYVADKYGEDRVAQITTFGTLASKAALRDVGRVLGMSYSDVDTVVKSLPDVKGGVTLKDALSDKEFYKVYTESPENRQLVDIAMKLEGMPRNASTHAAGVVITAEPISSYVPLSVNGGVTVTQYDMNTVAKLGLLKFDFLALRYLTVIDDTVRAINKDGYKLHLNKIPLDDEETFNLISQGLTAGVFQLENAGMRRMLMKMKPNRITDIMVAIALYRPGPMESIPTFLSNREKNGDYGYKIPVLNDILDETCGCIVYQEQVMEIFRAIAGYTYARADVVRRAIAKKKPGVIEEHRGTFVGGAVDRGYDKKAAEELFDSMVAFSNYAFKKSHSVAYGLISYQTAYLKAHFAPYYYSALLTSVYDDIPKMGVYLTECRARKIEVLPPDINESSTYFSVCDGKIRFGLSAIKGIGENFTNRLIAKRNERPYASFDDFVGRNISSDVGKKQLEGLIKAGAFDSLGQNRNSLLICMADQLEVHTKNARSGPEGQIGLFDSDPKGYAYPNVTELPLREKLLYEKESCGVYLTGSPLDGFSKHISDVNPAEIPALGNLRDKTKVVLCGTVTKCNQKITKNGDLMLFSGLEDGFSEVELVVFPNVTSEIGYLFAVGSPLLVSGEVQISERGVSVIVRTASPLIPDSIFVPEPKVKTVHRTEEADDVRHNHTEQPKAVSPQQTAQKKLYLRVDNLTCDGYIKARAITEIFEGEALVSFFDSEKKEYIKAGTTDASDYVLNELKRILGEQNVVLK